MSVDLRCPANPSRLFARLNGGGLPGQEIEVACRDCRRAEGQRFPDVVQVLHVWTADGGFVRTEVRRRP